MFQITSHLSPVVSSRAEVSSTQGVEPVNKVQAEHQSNVPKPKPFIDRRKNSDRRKHSAARGPFDLRCGRERRKGARKGRSIEVQV